MESIVFIKTQELKPDDNLVFDNYTDEDYARLKASIADIGIKYPLHITKDKKIVSGYHRWKVATELNLEYVPCVFVDDLEAVDVKYDLNICSRILTYADIKKYKKAKEEEKQKLIKELIKDIPSDLQDIVIREKIPIHAVRKFIDSLLSNRDVESKESYIDPPDLEERINYLVEEQTKKHKELVEREKKEKEKLIVKIKNLESYFKKLKEEKEQLHQSLDDIQREKEDLQNKLNEIKNNFEKAVIAKLHDSSLVHRIKTELEESFETTYRTTIDSLNKQKIALEQSLSEIEQKMENLKRDKEKEIEKYKSEFAKSTSILKSLIGDDSIFKLRVKTLSDIVEHLYTETDLIPDELFKTYDNKFIDELKEVHISISKLIKKMENKMQ